MAFNPYTPWFDGTTEPARIGEYECRLVTFRTGKLPILGPIVRIRWNGRKWSDKLMCCRLDKWRGLVKPYRQA